jgi:hypothetical protein
VLHHYVAAVLKPIAQLDQPADHGAHHDHLDPGAVVFPPHEPRRPVRRSGQVLLSAAGARPPAGIKIGATFRLVAPYELDARKWEDREWIDVRNSGVRHYTITTKDGRPCMARVDTFAYVETHPEAKALGPDGQPCGRLTKGLL